MLVGGHLSFEVPSYAVVQRCLAHACWPKNLAGLNLANPWPCKGIPEIIFTDNGKEFHSKSLKATEKALNTFIRPLPVMSPWLKGTVERLFGTMHVRVYGHKEGKTFSNSIKRGDYKSAKHAKTTLPKLREMLVKWIVDDYHTKEHAGLGGVSPIERWSELIKQNGPVTPPPDFDKIIEMTGEVVYKPIQKDGIHYLGLTWWAKEFTDLRKRRGGRVKHFQVRFDPFDLYEIRVLDEENGRYIHAECTNKELSMHVSRFAAKQHLTEAKRSGHEGFVSERDLEKAKSRVEHSAAKRLSGTGKISGARRAARYRNFNGIYLTPMAPDETSSIPSPDVANTTHLETRVSADEAPLSPRLPSDEGKQDAPLTTPETSQAPAEMATLVPKDTSEQDSDLSSAEASSKSTINDLVKAKMEEWR
jgi:putative transposase